ncbi:hypothetical protein LCDVSa003R [Lymphocystis disease virus 3]|uniref:Uncharacterized protein n=1 Tax=Lymphocystis disease virus 3 TaxID=2560566 RepID=A0A1B2RVR5_9VIRU|nr:hypothetical protein BZK12_gp003 [Lymphocystis disease virus Sa]AOC55087.1 hypothetical protein LCDVSa003R [Lymphocystis disease virus 3]
MRLYTCLLRLHKGLIPERTFSIYNTRIYSNSEKLLLRSNIR